MTAEELVQEIADQYGLAHLPPEAIDSALFEHTAFPLGGENLWREQLHEFFSKVGNPRLGVQDG